MKRFIRAFAKYEVYFFCAITLVSLIPVLFFETFPTVDGPAHLYNSRLIHELLTTNSDYLSSFFEFNKGLVPNWIGHFILSNLMFLFPALIAEKVLLSIYIVLLPFSVRFLSKQVSPEGQASNFALYFVFPFSYSFLFYFGFYNFHLGMVILFFTVGLWVKYSKSSPIKSKHLAFLIFLTLPMYFSHVFVFAIFVGVIGFISLVEFLKSPKPKADFYVSLKNRLLLIAPGCVLTVAYLVNNSVGLDNSENAISLYDSWLMIQNVAPARAIEYGKEGVFTKWIFILFVLIIINLLIVRFKNFKASLHQNTVIWGGISLGVLVGFFVIPDGSTFIKSRLLVFFFFFFIVFIGTQKINVWVRVISFILINYVNIALLKIYIESTSEANKITREIIDASQHVEAYSTVLPFDESGDWLFTHSSNYLGINKPIVVLENYEAALGYFPLVWNENEIPYLHLGDSTQTPLHFAENSAHTKSQIDYIFVLSAIEDSENEEKIEIELQNILDRFYRLTYTSESKTIRLYEKL